MIGRQLNISKTNNLFLFGARGTGKSTLLKKLFPKNDETLWIDLLKVEDEEHYGRRPQELELILKSNSYRKVVIDEIQKSPKLLDIVHLEIENSRDIQFILTGSSARKLKRGGANLLAGRAFTNYLFPFTYMELKNDFHLMEVLKYGSLPQAFSYNDKNDKIDFLRSYTRTYLKEEIQIEQLVRNVNPFRDFLEITAQCNGEIINYSKIARDVGVDDKTVSNYFQILEDTLIGFFLNPFRRSIRKRQLESPKFYLFDTGVKRALERTLNVELKERTYAFGKAFEHFVILEIFRINEYQKKDFRLSYLKTKDGAEIDLVLERPGAEDVLIEIKSTSSVREEDVGNLNRFKASWDKPCKCYLLSLDKNIKTINNVDCVYCLDGIKLIFSI